MLGVCYQIEVAIVIFTAFSPFNLYAIINCLTTSSDIELQFSDSVSLFITLLKVFCTFALSFKGEELLSNTL